MEVAKIQPSDIMEMNYIFFNDYVQWKIDLEKEKKKRSDQKYSMSMQKIEKENKVRKFKMELERRKLERGKK